MYYLLQHIELLLPSCCTSAGYSLYGECCCVAASSGEMVNSCCRGWRLWRNNEINKGT